MKAPLSAPEPKFKPGDQAEVDVPAYPSGTIVGEVTWHPSGQWRYEVKFRRSAKTFRWTENRLQKRREH